MADYLKQMLHGKLVGHKRYISPYGEDMPEILDWTWQVSARQFDSTGALRRK
jgi:phosphoketolase